MKRNVEVQKEIREAFQTKLTECVNIARQRTNKEVPMFPLKFSQMGHRAGVCHTVVLTGESTIKINPDFFKNPKDYDEQLNDTLPHEVAHAIVNFLYPIITVNGKHRRPVAPHGSEWFGVMNWFGIKNPNTRHKMDMTGVAVRKVDRLFKYVCGCNKPHMLTFTLHKRIQLNGKNRKCRKCKQRIVFQKSPGTPLINLNAPKVKPKIAVIIPIKLSPPPPATHRVVTRFIDGVLQNERVPLTPEEMAV